MKSYQLLIMASLALCLPLLPACSSTPFVAASESQPGDGKIPVKAVASANASGNTADSSNVAYNSGVSVVFGSNVPQDKRALLLKKLGVQK